MTMGKKRVSMKSMNRKSGFQSVREVKSHLSAYGHGVRNANEELRERVERKQRTRSQILQQSAKEALLDEKGVVLKPYGDAPIGSPQDRANREFQKGRQAALEKAYKKGAFLNAWPIKKKKPSKKKKRNRR